MNIVVRIPTAFRRLTGDVDRLECSPGSLPELLTILEDRFPGVKPHLRDRNGQVRQFLNIYVNDEDIRFLGGNAYRFQDGDEVMLIPSIAGGKQAGP